MNAKDKAKQKEYRSKLNDLDLEARDKQYELMKQSNSEDEIKAMHADISKRKTALHAEYYGTEPQSSDHWFYR